jgi:hypothetical protein
MKRRSRLPYPLLKVPHPQVGERVTRLRSMSEIAADLAELFEGKPNNSRRRYLFNAEHYAATGVCRWVQTDLDRAFHDTLDKLRGGPKSGDDVNPYEIERGVLQYREQGVR